MVQTLPMLLFSLNARKQRMIFHPGQQRHMAFQELLHGNNTRNLADPLAVQVNNVRGARRVKQPTPGKAPLIECFLIRRTKALDLVTLWRNDRKCLGVET